MLRMPNPITMTMNDIEFLMHPEWWAKESGLHYTLLLKDDAPDEAKKAYEEYLALIRWADDNQIDF